ncbi:uncharacterized protein A4U43_C05F22510 [Asparagus officinalis]|uniref:Mandelate racemase/muconate lactonizing enzyme C-terminal domain-containing protein n=1 Tax=Asparagus officinalis TaxID=4686 RepID=A0A5P1ETN5_ASPOF|nr:uncharacterized protein A4U43_C05F22510 [Asparagus officinalis]
MLSTNFLQNPKPSNLPSPFPQFQFLHHRQTLRKPPSSKPWRARSNLALLASNLLRVKRNPSLKAYAENGDDDRIGGLGVDVDDLHGEDEFVLPVELSFTRTLPPALTLKHGVGKLREAVEKLKLDPPCSNSGVLRYQVAVPPSVKALDWLYCQQKFSNVFPQFHFVGKQIDEGVLDNGNWKVSGIGAAIYFHGSSAEGCYLMARYLSIDSHLIRAYGFVGMSYGRMPSFVEQKPGSFYFLIPQVELNQLENGSFMSLNLIWDDSLAYTFGEAVKSVEKCFQQVYLNAEVLAQLDARGNCMQLEELPTCKESYFRPSTTVSFRTNMFPSPCGISCSVKQSANINILWASLIVEECVRLGLTYFCIAPGSRSSPLAISACRHPLTTCISCFDERSLAFHAVGYGRGSRKPAVIITTSGTAVSNLFPAVVEASYDFVPLMLLTADRPPELLDAGANQAIDQVNHFGKFTRFFFNFPPPSDQIPARMVLTTIDSAAHRATQAPFGPVHINCPFREPLEDHPREWKSTCLSGLDTWMSNIEPFTRYIDFHSSTACHENSNEVVEILQIIQNANKGLLIIGAIHTEDEIWAAFLLTKHLLWPVVADILSGLRLRRVLSSFSEIEDHVLFIDHLDHALLSDSVKNWAQPDVVVQIGSKITSKRIGQFLEFSCPQSYILVDSHPCRHDPSYIVTHRVQSTVTEFTDVLLKVQVSKNASNWSLFLKALNMMVSQEISFLIRSEPLLTEPHVAHIIGEAFHGEVALFIGNSMIIRDMDMYGRGWMIHSTDDSQLIDDSCLQFHGIQVAGNRGASGIDGLLSTAVGFSVGSDKKVLCVIGDVSFLHDTNGLAILNQRSKRKPMTILIVNNHGGAIFSLLPVADRTPTSVLNQYFYTSHDISVRNLCSAHSVKHLLVRTKSELQCALWKAHKDQNDIVIEVESSIADNSKFHRTISKFVSQASDQALRVLSKFPFSEKTSGGQFLCKVREMKYSLYRIQLCAPLTSSQVKNDINRFYREGFILAIALDDGSVGFGEVAPVEIHKEDLSAAEEQLRFLFHVMEGVELDYILPLAYGSFSNWIWRSLGIPPQSVFPSVRCGLEMALLNALAVRHASSLSGLITGCGCSSQYTKAGNDDISVRSSEGIAICALVDCNGSPKEVAHLVSQLVDEGFTTIKLKVARRKNPEEDASIIQEIRKMVGYQVNIRADANRKWTYEQAIRFGSSVKNCNLQYIEEPVCLEDDIVRFCEETGLPVALDETTDDLEVNALEKLNKFAHPGIVAVVIKPSVVGGFENASLIAKWAHTRGKMPIISSVFESSLSLSSYIQFVHQLEQQNEAICKLQNREVISATAHGLGTYRWLKEDVSTDVLKICVPAHSNTMEASIEDADNFLRNFQLNNSVVERTYEGEQVRSCQFTVCDEEFSHSFNLLESGSETDSNIVVFLHGFLGTSQDWIPVMKAMSATARCLSIDLPGHGHSLAYWRMNKKPEKGYDISVESVADGLMKLICNLTSERVILVGYSMGARIALYMALKYSEKIDAAIIVSGSPGLRDEPARRIRAVQDEAKARYLMAHGLECFLDIWYAGKLWKSLRGHPHFKKITTNRAKHRDIQALAKVLSGLSVGRQLPLWEDLKLCKKPLLFIAGEKDAKFKDISQQMYTEVMTARGEGDNQGTNLCEMAVIPDCGHAVHMENPLPLINIVRKFLIKVRRG